MILNLEEEIINKRSGVHYIRLDQEEKLKEKLKEMRKNGLFEKYDMSYVIMTEYNHILLGFQKSLDYLL